MKKNNWKQEIDKARPEKVRIFELTQEQKEFLIYARQNEKPVHWKLLAPLWNKEFPQQILTADGIRSVYRRHVE
jgi:hypothetical protein